MTKSNARYRLPDQCCANCIHSYMNSYGDCQCSQLAPGDVITEGAICDLYMLEPGAVALPAEATVVPVPWDKPVGVTCMHCKYSFLNGTFLGCVRSNKEINPTGNCKKWEGIVPQETPEVKTTIDIYNGDCSDCSFSMYKDNDPYCSFHNVGIVPDGYCDDYKREVTE